MVRVLIIKTSSLGDIIHAFPAIQFLKEIKPDCQIDWIVEERCSSLIKAHPLVDQVLCIDTRKWRKAPFASIIPIKQFRSQLQSTTYDVVFDLQGNLKSGCLAFLTHAQEKWGFAKEYVAEKGNLLFTRQKVNPLPGKNIRWDYLSLIETWAGQKALDLKTTSLVLNEIEKKQLNELIRQKCGRNILVCPSSHWKNKMLERNLLFEFLRKIQKEFLCTLWFSFGSVQESHPYQDLANKLNAHICEPMSLPLLQHWMKEMDHVVSMDSLPLHLAAEAEVPTFSVFGPSSSLKYQPIGPNHHSYQGVCPYKVAFEKRCPILRSCSTGSCTQAANVEALFRNYTAFLKCLP